MDTFNGPGSPRWTGWGCGRDLGECGKADGKADAGGAGRGSAGSAPGSPAASPRTEGQAPRTSSEDESKWAVEREPSANSKEERRHVGEPARARGGQQSCGSRPWHPAEGPGRRGQRGVRCFGNTVVLVDF